MGFFKGLFDKMGDTHLRMLTKDCMEIILNTLWHLKEQRSGAAYLEDALDKLIREGGYTVMQDENIKDEKTKLFNFVALFVIRNLGRPIDYRSNELKVLDDEIEMYWIRMKDKGDVLKP
jgi:hypothetical protein